MATKATPAQRKYLEMFINGADYANQYGVNISVISRCKELGYLETVEGGKVRLSEAGRQAIA